MAEYIEREAAMRAVGQFARGFRYTEGKCVVHGCVTEIKKVPAADVAPVVRCKDCVSVIGNDVAGYVCQNQLCPCYARVVPGDFSCTCGESKEVYRNG